jgi:hypothetical protein
VLSLQVIFNLFETLRQKRRCKKRADPPEPNFHLLYATSTAFA